MPRCVSRVYACAERCFCLFFCTRASSRAVRQKSIWDDSVTETEQQQQQQAGGQAGGDAVGKPSPVMPVRISRSGSSVTNHAQLLRAQLRRRKTGRLMIDGNGLTPRLEPNSPGLLRMARGSSHPNAVASPSPRPRPTSTSSSAAGAAEKRDTLSSLAETSHTEPEPAGSKPCNKPSGVKLSRVQPSGVQQPPPRRKETVKPPLPTGLAPRGQPAIDGPPSPPAAADPDADSAAAPAADVSSAADAPGTSTRVSFECGDSMSAPPPAALPPAAPHPVETPERPFDVLHPSRASAPGAPSLVGLGQRLRRVVTVTGKLGVAASSFFVTPREDGSSEGGDGEGSLSGNSRKRSTVAPFEHAFEGAFVDAEDLAEQVTATELDPVQAALVRRAFRLLDSMSATLGVLGPLQMEYFAHHVSPSGSESTPFAAAC